MKKAAIAIFITAALLTACGKSGTDHSAHEGMSGMSQGEHMNHSEQTKDAKQSDNVQAHFMLSAERPQPNQDIIITVHIQDKDGKAIDKFDIQHEKQMHIIVVSKDLSFFNHIHPEYKGNGDFTVTTQFPAAGDYKVIADFVPTGMGAMTKSQPLTVQGSAPAAKPVEPDASLTKTVDGKEITLTFDQLKSGAEVNMNFNFKDAQTKQPVTDLQPYLGAVGHVVILSQDTENYLHVHPTDEKAKGPDAKFMTIFPHAGVYKIWGQFQQNGKVFTVPFVVKVS